MVATAPSHQLGVPSCRRSDSCGDCVGPEGEDVSGGYYEAGGSFLKLGLVEAFLVRRLSAHQQIGRMRPTSSPHMSARCDAFLNASHCCVCDLPPSHPGSLGKDVSDLGPLPRTLAMRATCQEAAPSARR